MRSLLRAFPAFTDLFTEIEIWSTELDKPPGTDVVWKNIRKRLPLTALHMVDFQYRVTHRIAKSPPSPDTVVLTTGCNVPRADIHYMHYWNIAMLEEQHMRSNTFPILPHHRLVAALVARTERQVASDCAETRWWWSVSRSISEKIASDGARGRFRILPNPYDPEAFNPSVRERWRNEMRSHYGIEPRETVFVFSSYGHFERKGLLQAAETMDILRKRGLCVRLLVLGGNERSLADFRRKLSSLGIDQSALIFAGLVKPVQNHLVAADALLFPSHFEAFSLAEIEAAALGLRLYLTPHYGSEMILREPSNGRFLPWDPLGMADVLEEDLRQGRLGESHGEMGEAITTKTFAEQIRGLFEEVITAKKNGHV